MFFPVNQREKAIFTRKKYYGSVRFHLFFNLSKVNFNKFNFNKFDFNKFNLNKIK